MCVPPIRSHFGKANGRAYLLNGRAYMINDKTDYMLRGKQSKLPDWCDATASVVRTQRCDGYAGTRHILAQHFAIVDNIHFSGKSTDKAMWLKPAAVTRPFPSR